MANRAISLRAKRRKAPASETIRVRSGSVTTRIYTMQRESGCYYLVAWQCGTKRERHYCRTLEEARKFAKAQADRIAAGTAQSARISMVEAQIFREAQRRMVLTRRAEYEAVQQQSLTLQPLPENVADIRDPSSAPFEELGVLLQPDDLRVLVFHT